MLGNPPNVSAAPLSADQSSFWYVRRRKSGSKSAVTSSTCLQHNNVTVFNQNVQLIIVQRATAAGGDANENDPGRRLALVGSIRSG